MSRRSISLASIDLCGAAPDQEEVLLKARYYLLCLTCFKIAAAVDSVPGSDKVFDVRPTTDIDAVP